MQTFYAIAHTFKYLLTRSWKYYTYADKFALTSKESKNRVLIKFFWLIIRATKVIGAHTRNVGNGTTKTFRSCANARDEAELD